MDYLLKLLDLLGVDGTEEKHTVYLLVESIWTFAGIKKDEDLEMAAWELMTKLKDKDAPDLALLLRPKSKHGIKN